MRNETYFFISAAVVLRPPRGAIKRAATLRLDFHNALSPLDSFGLALNQFYPYGPIQSTTQDYHSLALVKIRTLGRTLDYY
jgi:hypothetical protein